jgi:basic amino acid/polyamine antiporter, APA family
MGGSSPRLRRDLGRVDSYAALIGILVGAGIYMASKDAYLVTGPSLVLGYAVLAPFILCIAIPYAAFQSTPSLAGLGGDYAHLKAVFGDGLLSFLAAWLKIVSYVGALVYLAEAMAGYLIQAFALAGLVELEASAWQRIVATACMVGFWMIHCAGVRWFGRMQVAMCLVLGVSILVLVVPGVFAIDVANFQPFFTAGSSAFLGSLPILFFAYAGFEALAHTAGETRDSHRNLPTVYLRGILVTTVTFIAMSAVVVGVLDAEAMQASRAPMADAAKTFLSGGGALIVAVGGVFAAATSVNATLIVPPRLVVILAEDGCLPHAFRALDARTRAPVIGLTATLALGLGLLWTGWVAVALNIAVLALMSVYLLHSIAFLRLEQRNPALAATVDVRLPRALQKTAAWAAIFALTLLIAWIVNDDFRAITGPDILERYSQEAPTGTELLVFWSLVGWVLYRDPAKRQ